MAAATGSRRVINFRPAGQSTTGISSASGPSRAEAEPTLTETSASDAVVSTAAPSGYFTTIQNLGGGIVLVKPLYVRVDFNGSEFLVSSADLSLVGRGESEFEAVDDLRDQIRELFASLREMRETLGPYLVAQLQFLEALAQA